MGGPFLYNYIIMSDNNYNYSVFNMPNDNWARNNGWNLRASTNGTWFIGHRYNQGNSDAVGRLASALPDYASQALKDFYNANKYLTHNMAKQLTRIMASSEGASDGWYFDDTGIV